MKVLLSIQLDAEGKGSASQDNTCDHNLALDQLTVWFPPHCPARLTRLAIGLADVVVAGEQEWRVGFHPIFWLPRMQLLLDVQGTPHTSIQVEIHTLQVTP